MRSVGVREFRDQATTLMGSGETLVIERHGQPIGFFVPVTAKDRKAGRKVLGRLGAAVESVLEATDLSEDELVAEVTGRRRRR
jgi:antitoxin (DNA-binding transcriptional repressor) of toxin-antitoxin stability system